MATTVQRFIIECTNWRNEVPYRKLSSEQYHNEIQAKREYIKSLPLKREQYACSEVLNAMIHDISVYDITLAYQYKGMLYVTSRHKVPGCKNTKVLHDNRMIKDSAEWDSLPKFNVWSKTGEILAPVL